MINPFLLASAPRLDHWKEFRKHISELSEIEKLEKVAQYWSLAPLKNIAYDCEAPDTWPTMWEMIIANDWCRNSVAIAMDGTLRLVGFDPSRLTLGMIIDRDISVMTMVLNIDDRFLLNYDWALLVPYPTTKHTWLKKFRWCGKKYLEL